MTCQICLFDSSRCVCQPSWASFAKDLEEARPDDFEKIKLSELSVSTMTYSVKLGDNVEVDLYALSESPRTSLFCKDIKFKEGSRRAGTETKYQFYNQCSITSYVPDESDPEKSIKVSTKIFNNGSLNFTGVKSVRYMVHMLRSMLIFLTEIPGVMRISGPLTVSVSKISMINTDFNIGVRIRQRALCDLLSGYSDQVKSCAFEPGHYNGVKINFAPDPLSETYVTRKGIRKHNGEVTIAAFNTGNFIITGGNCIRDIIYAYRWIARVIEDNFDLVTRPRSEDDSQISKGSKVYRTDSLVRELIAREKDVFLESHQSRMSAVFAAILAIE